MNVKIRSINSLFIIGFGILVTVSMLVNPTLLRGKAKEVGDVEEITLDELMNIEVTVASRSKEKAVEAPSSITVFTAEDIRQMGISYLEELLDFVPGFQVTRDVEQGTALRISARGRSSALSESVLFLVNGQRINDLYTGGISILNRRLAVENIKQVEIIRGPGSALYGSNAFLGVVNIITQHDVNNVTASGGSMKSRAMAVNFSRLVFQGLSLSAFVKIFSEKGFLYDEVEDIYGRTGSTRDPVKGMDAYFTCTYKNFTLHARHMERTVEDFLTFGTLANFTNRENSKQTSILAHYQVNLNKALDMELSAGYLEDQWKTLTVLIPKDVEIAPGFALSETFEGGPFLESYHANGNIDFNFQVSSANKLSWGVSYLVTGITDVANLMTHHPITLDYYGQITRFQGDESFNAEKTRNILGIYLQDKHSFGKRLGITLGLRYDHYNDFGDTLNPRAALVYATPWQGTLKLMYGRAFRAPNFLELYDKNNPVDFGNPELEPEKVQTIELAYTQSSKTLQGTLTYFNNRIKDIIVLGDPVSHPDNPLEAPRFINSGELETNGLEFDFTFTPIKKLLLRGSFTHYFKGDELYVSPNSASLVINFKSKRFNINVNGIFREKMKLLPQQDSYFLVNGALRFELVHGFKLTAAVKNLFDRRYYTVSLAMPQGVINRGRTLSLGIFAEL